MHSPVRVDAGGCDHVRTREDRRGSPPGCCVRVLHGTLGCGWLAVWRCVALCGTVWLHLVHVRASLVVCLLCVVAACYTGAVARQRHHHLPCDTVRISRCQGRAGHGAHASYRRHSHDQPRPCAQRVDVRHAPLPLGRGGHCQRPRWCSSPVASWHQRRGRPHAVQGRD